MHQVNDLKAVLDAVNVTANSPAILAGHSMGAMDNLLFYYFYPQYVRGYILYATGPGFAKESGWMGWQKFCRKRAAVLEREGLKSLAVSEQGKGHRSGLGLALACRGALMHHKDDPLFKCLSDGVLHLANHLDDFGLPVKIMV